MMGDVQFALDNKSSRLSIVDNDISWYQLGKSLQSAADYGLTDEQF